MKQLLISLGFVLVLFSCQNSVSTSPQVIGHQMTDDGESIDIIAGNLDNVQIWKDYVKAHNDRDLEAIKGMNVDSIKVWGPRGEYIEGTEAHIQFLSEWFAGASPVWNSKYFLANTYTNKKGNLMEWVTSGHDLTMTIDSTEVKVFQVHDALIKDGKVVMFTVAEQEKRDKNEE
jgi:hypothetical protein